ncbi:MAG TPA: hypothetical protein VKR06_46530 [Ktedonosporobacter sp.]|nr:hypothetical protein [Ktedonosporobacter sp.]
MKVVGWIVTVVIGIVLSSAWMGYVLSILWEWFISPIFHIGTITIPLAIGLSLVVRMLTTSGYQESDEKQKGSTQQLLSSCVYVFLSLPCLRCLLARLFTLLCRKGMEHE